MPRPHSTMRKTRDVLRLHFSEGLSLRQTASSLSMPFTTVADLAKRAKAAGLSWPLEDEARRLKARAWLEELRQHQPEFLGH